MTSTLRVALHPLAHLEHERRCQRDVFPFPMHPAGRVITVANPDLVGAVTAAGRERLLGGAGNRRTLPLLPEGSVFLTDGDENERRRTGLRPVIEELHAVVPLVEQAFADEASRFPSWRPFPLLRAIRAALLDALGRTLHEEARARAGAMLTPVALAGTLGRRPLSASWWPPARIYGRREPRAADALPATGGIQEADRTALLLAFREPAAIALAWLFHDLVRDAALWERACTGSDAIVDALVAESLRLHPPFIGAFRAAALPIELGRHRIAAGQPVMVSISSLQRDPTLHRDPLAFDPERFLNQGAEGPGWLPFGVSPRTCLGRDLAVPLLRAAVRGLARTTRLSPAVPRRERTVLISTALLPAVGCLVRTSSGVHA